jgi:hypothetical protein
MTVVSWLFVSKSLVAGGHSCAIVEEMVRLARQRNEHRANRMDAEAILSVHPRNTA